MRKQTRGVACPNCSAPAGEPCIGTTGVPRKSHHLERAISARESVEPATEAMPKDADRRPHGDRPLATERKHRALSDDLPGEIADALTGMVDALDAEIETVLDRGRTRTIAFDRGKRERAVAGSHTYRFKPSRRINAPIEAVSVTVTARGITQSGEFLGQSEEYVDVAVRRDLGESVGRGSIEVNPTAVLEATADRIDAFRAGEVGDVTPVFERLLAGSGADAVAAPGIDVAVDADLDRFQESAIQAALDHELTFIWGPPGTGKTRTAAALAAALVGCGKRVLMTAHAHVAVDSAVVAALAAGAAPVRRLGNPQLREVPDDVVVEGLDDDADAVGLDAMTLSKLVVTPALADRRWDYVILDEASMALLPQAVVAATLGDRFVVCGDVRQLSPVVQSARDPKVARWLGRDLFEIAGIADEIRAGTDTADDRLRMLRRQYRAHPDIAEVTNEFAYDGRLESAPETSGHDMLAHTEPAPGAAVVVCDTGSLSPVSIRPETSRCNPTAATIVASIAAGIVAKAPALTSERRLTGIATPYVEQMRLLRELLDDLDIGDYVEVGTVHRFQGGERQAIIVDLCDANPYRPPPMLAGDEGLRLLNVAMSRARSKLVLVADTSWLRDGRSGIALRLAGEHGTIVDAAELAGLDRLDIDGFLADAKARIARASTRVLVRAPKVDALIEELALAGRGCESVAVHARALDDPARRALEAADVRVSIDKRINERLVVVDGAVFTGNTRSAAARAGTAMLRTESPGFAARLATALDPRG